MRYLTLILCLISIQAFAKSGLLADLNVVTPAELKSSEFAPLLKKLEQLKTLSTSNELLSSPQLKNQKMRDGGFSGGGGGGGVICDGKLSFLDYWEFRKNLVMAIIPAEKESSMIDYVQGVIRQSLSMDAPLLVHEITQTLDLIAKQPWIATKSLPFVDDAGELHRPLESNCQRTQLVIRFVDQETKQIFFLYDQDRMEQLRRSHSSPEAQINIAMMLLHEALYLLGVDLSMQTSHQIRPLAAGLLAVDFVPLVPLKKAHLSFTLLQLGFKPLWLNLNSQFLNRPNSVGRFNSYTRSVSFLKMIERKNKWMKYYRLQESFATDAFTIAEATVDSPKISQMRRSIFQEILKEGSEEEIFLYHHLVHSQYVGTTDHLLFDSEEQENRLARACAHLYSPEDLQMALLPFFFNRQELLSSYRPILQKARSYCQALNLKRRY